MNSENERGLTSVGSNERTKRNRQAGLNDNDWDEQRVYERDYCIFEGNGTPEKSRPAGWWLCVWDDAFDPSGMGSQRRLCRRHRSESITSPTLLIPCAGTYIPILSLNLSRSNQIPRHESRYISDDAYYMNVPQVWPENVFAFATTRPAWQRTHSNHIVNLRRSRSFSSRSLLCNVLLLYMISMSNSFVLSFLSSFISAVTRALLPLPHSRAHAAMYTG